MAQAILIKWMDSSMVEEIKHNVNCLWVHWRLLQIRLARKIKEFDEKRDSELGDSR